MKRLILPLMITTCVGFAFAQDATPVATPPAPPAPGASLPPPPPPPPKVGKKKQNPDNPALKQQIKQQMAGVLLRGLPDAERARVEDARQKALQDPELAALRDKAEEANRKFMEAMRAKVQQIDPGVEEIIRKNMQGALQGNRPQGQGQLNRPLPPPPVSEADRVRFEAAREKAKDSPVVRAAEEFRSKAQSREEHQAAREAHVKAMRMAIIEADPSLKDVVEKMMPHPPLHNAPVPPQN